MPRTVVNTVRNWLFPTALIIMPLVGAYIALQQFNQLYG